MFKLPKCPYCNTVYRYKDTNEALKNKNNTCYHCGKKFIAKRFPDVLALCAITLVLCILINFILLSKMIKFNFVLLFIITLLFVVAAYFLIPFFTQFKKNEENDGNHKND